MADKDKTFTDQENLYLLDLYKKLDNAEKDNNEEAALKAFKALQSFYISKEDMPDKLGKAWESTMGGLAKGETRAIGLPTDISNLILALGEKGVKGIMNAIGFEISPEATILSKEPFLGSKQVEKLFNKLGIKTDYDKTRLMTAITGRIAEEVGINLPLMTIPLAGATPKNMLKIGAVETSAALSAGSGAAWAQQIDPAKQIKIPGTDIPLNLEAWAMALGYISPITVMSAYKVLDNQVGLNLAFSTIFKPKSTATKQAASILFSKLDDANIAKLLSDLEKKNMTREQIFKKYGLTEEDIGGAIFGESVNQTNFPRLLDDILSSEELTILRDQIIRRPEGMELAQAIEAYKLTRMIELENRLRKNLLPAEYTPVKDGDIIPGTVSLAIENRIQSINSFVSQRLVLAEKIAAEKMALIGPTLSRDMATKILRQELAEGLDDMLRMEKQLWGNVKNTKVNAQNLGDTALEILMSQFKTTPNASIPKILKDLAGQERLYIAGLIQVPANKVKFLKQGLLDKGKQSVDEILNLKALIHDEIRRAQKLGTRQGDLLAENYKKILDEVDGTLIGGVTEKNIEAANTALSYSNKLQDEIYSGSVGSLLEYNVKKSADGVPLGQQIIEAKKFNDLMSHGEAGGVASADFLKIIKGESEGLVAKVKDDVARLIDTRTGNLPAKALENYMRNNKEIIDQIGGYKIQYTDKFGKSQEVTLKQALADADAAKRLVEDRLGSIVHTEKDLAKYRSETLLSDKDLGLSNNTIIKRIFQAEPEDALGATDNIIKILNRGDESGLALQGFQDSVTEYIFSAIKPLKEEGKAILNLKQTTSFIKNNKEALIKIYGDDGYALWKEFSDTLEAIQPALLKGNVGVLDAFAKNNIFVSAIGRITGAKLGAAGLGPPLVLAGLGGRIANKLIGTKTESEIIRILSRAFRDPDFATTLIKSLSDDIADQIQSNINRFLKDDKALLTTGVRVGAETMEDEINVPQTKPQAKTFTPTIPGANAESRMAKANIVPPLDTGMMPAATAGGIDRDRAALAFGPGDILAQQRPQYAAQGGIMSTNKAFQRVA